MVIASIVSAILFNSRIIRPISHFNVKCGVCISLPAMITRNGATSVAVSLNQKETEAFDSSVQALKAIIEKFE